jgi:hypothetical protein
MELWDLMSNFDRQPKKNNVKNILVTARDGVET